MSVNKKITELSTAAALDGTEEIPLVQGGVTVKGTIDGLGLFKNGGNSFGANASIGTNDAFYLLFRAGNTNNGVLTDSKEWGFGVTTPFANTHKSNKSLGHTSGSYAERWTNSDDDVIAWIRNDGFLYANVIGNDDSNNLEITQGGGGNKIKMFNGAQVEHHANTYFQFFSNSGVVGIGGSGILAATIATSGGTEVIDLNSRILKSGWTANMSLTDYANNAAAITGGLSTGDLYRTGGAVMIVI